MKNIQFIYAGTVNAGGSKGSASVTGSGDGICTLAMHPDGTLSFVSSIESANSGIITRYGNCIYAANEVRDFTGLPGSGGGVSAYRIEENGHLCFLNSSISYGSRPSSVAVSQNGKCLLVTNHGSHSAVVCRYEQNENGKWILNRGFDDSSIAVFRLSEDGSIGELTDLHILKGSGYWCHGGGQSAAHLHCVRIKDDFVIACNRGSDRIEAMRLDEETGKLTVLNQFETEPGYAPRHAVFHTDKNILYAVNENYPSVSVFSFDPDSGDMKEIQKIGTMDEAYYAERPLPHFNKRHADEGEKNTSGFGDRGAVMCSDIHISDNGKWLYASNRRFSSAGSLSVFDIHEDGTLTMKQLLQLDGKDPRGFQIISDQYLIIGLLDQNRADLFELDENGMIKEKTAEIAVGSPSSFVL